MTAACATQASRVWTTAIDPAFLAWLLVLWFNFQPNPKTKLLRQVRSAAALAAGRCAAAFPAESEPWQPELWPLLRGLLDDNVPSVRGDAAVALADVVRAWGKPMLDLLLPALRCAHSRGCPCACLCRRKTSSKCQFDAATRLPSHRGCAVYVWHYQVVVCALHSRPGRACSYSRRPVAKA